MTFVHAVVMGNCKVSSSVQGTKSLEVFIFTSEKNDFGLKKDKKHYSDLLEYF